MNKKLGMSIVFSVILLFLALATAGIVYTTITNVYGAQTRDDFSFEVDGGKTKTYEFVVGESNQIKLVLPAEIDQNDVKIIESDSRKLLKIDGNEITGIKVGSGTIKASIEIDDVVYETTAGYKVVAESSNSKNTTTEENNKDKEESSATNDTNKETSTTNTNSKEESKNSSTTTKSKNVTYSIEFDKDSRVATYSGKNTSLGSYLPKKSGMQITDLEWKSSDESVATVADSSGKINIKGVGETTITASYSAANVSDSYKLTVYPNELEVIDTKTNKNITDSTVELMVGESLEIDLNDSNKKIDDKDISYTTNSGKICSVDENGVITAKSKGTTTVKGMLTDNNKSNGMVKIVVVGGKEDAILKGNISFPTDEKTKKPIVYTGENAVLVGTELKIDMVKPEGADEYPIEYSCSNKNILQIDGENIKAVQAGSGTLTAKMKVGNKIKSASTKIEVFNNQEEKTKANGEEVKFINVNFDKESMAIKVGNTVTLKPKVETNMLKKDYKLVYSASEEGYIELNKNTGRLKTLKAGKVDVTVSVEDKPEINSKITLDIQDEVVLVSKFKLKTELPLKNSAYQVATNEPYTIEFEVLPETATLKDYTLEVEDTENFILNDNILTALNPGKKTKLNVIAQDSGNKKESITIESVISEDELNALDSILDTKEINIKVGETLNFRNVQDTNKKVLVTKATKNNFTMKTDNNMITITGKKLGSGTITVKYDDNVLEIPVNVIEEKEVQEDPNPVTNIEFPVDNVTAQTKDYVNDHPFVVGECYEVSDNLDIYPLNAKNKDVSVTVNNPAFTVTPDGNVIANKPNEVALMTVTSAYNSSVKQTISIASVSPEIESFAFPRDYIGENSFDINKGTYPWGFGMIIKTTSGITYNPKEDMSLLNNEEYKRLRDQLVIECDKPEILRITNNIVYPVEGVQGSGILTAYLKTDRSKKATCKYEANGIDKNITIKKVEFAQSTYKLKVGDNNMGFCPIITLSNGKKFDSTNEKIRNSAEYKSYLSQLKLVKIDKVKSGMTNTGSLVRILDDKENLLIDAVYAGKCQIGIAFKNSNNAIATTILDITDGNESVEDNNVKAEIEKIDPSTTTDNKNLKITNVKFASRSYTINGNYGHGINPIIILSDGTTLNQHSANQEVYKYYAGLTELFLTNSSTGDTVDFGVLQIINDTLPKQLIPLKNGKVSLAIGVINRSKI